MNSALVDNRERPIPLLDAKRKVRIEGIPGIAQGGYRLHPYEIGHPAAAERLVNVKSHPYNIAGDNYYYRETDTIYGGRIEGSMPELLIREGVAERLVEVNSRLREKGVELYLFDGWRPLEVAQNARGMFENRLRRNYPDWNDDKVLGVVNMFWAIPAQSYDQIDPYSPPPHMTGAVADLTLRNISTHQLLEMGSIFDDVSLTAFPEHFERVVRAQIAVGKLPSYTAEMARRNRRELYWAFEGPDLPADTRMSVNATEIWHVSNGDQLDARYESGRRGQLVKAVYPLIVAS